MPIIRKSVSVPANDSVDNAIDGSIYEFMPFNAAISIGVLMPAGSTIGDILATVNTGSDTLLEESPVNNKAGFPVIPDDMDLQDVTGQGERLVIKLRNTTGAAIIVNLLVQITPI